MEALLQIIAALWPLSEITLAVIRRARGRDIRRRDRGSAALLWVVITIGVTLAILSQSFEPARIRLPLGVRPWLALILLVGGIGIRWTAIVALGRHFTVDVAILDEHRLIRSGLFRYVRHPSYLGLLMAFLGLGFVFGNWLSLASLVVPCSAAILYRIQVEEAALTEKFGDQYREYRRATWRLVPFVY